MRKTIWDTVYEKYGTELNMTREQVYDMAICELEQVIYGDDVWDEEKQQWVKSLS